MASGIIGLLHYLNRNKDLAAAEAIREQEIAARRDADIAVQKAQLEQQQRYDDIRAVTNDKELMENLYQNALIDMKDPVAARAEAQKQFYAYKASGPQAETGRNKLTTSMTDLGIAKASGALPLASTAGRAEIQAGIAGDTAAEAENLNRYNTARERATTAPMLSRELDLEGVEKAKLGQTLTNTARSFAPQLAEVQARSGISEGNKDIAQNNYTSTMFSKLDAPLAAEAQNAGMGSAKAEADLSIATRGLVKPGAATPLFAPNQLTQEPFLKLPGLQNLLQQVLQNSPPAAPGTNAITARPGAILNLYNLRRGGGKAQ